MLRFAPSPTGDMHIGSLRVALFNYILSVQKNEGLVVRIEDTDTARNVEGKETEIIGLLDLFGIKYQDIVYQSSNLKYHRAMALQLLHEKIAFNCFCKPTLLEAKMKKAKLDGEAYRYDDACLSLTPEQTIDNESGFTVRLRKPNVNVEFTDTIKGKMSFSPTDIDSFIILAADKSPTYNFACAVDDMISDVSMVIRNDNYLSDTPKQIAVRAALNYTKEIEYAHLPSLLNEEDNNTNVKRLLEEGFIPEAIINYLLLLGNETPQEIFSLQDALEFLDLAKISKIPAKFEIDKLRFINKEHLNNLDDVELSRYVGFADGDIGKLAKLYLDEVSTTRELKVKIGAIFAEKVIPEAFAKGTTTMKEVLLAAPFFEKFDDFNAYLKKETGLTGDNYLKSLRLLLSSEQEGPDLAQMYPFIKNYMTEIVK